MNTKIVLVKVKFYSVVSSSERCKGSDKGEGNVKQEEEIVLEDFLEVIFGVEAIERMKMKKQVQFEIPSLEKKKNDFFASGM